MTRSMSYSRYFRTATAMAAYRHQRQAEHHLQRGHRRTRGSRVQPDLRGPEDRTTTAAAPASSAAGTKMTTAVRDPGYHPPIGHLATLAEIPFLKHPAFMPAVTWAIARPEA
jgi:hypothetical protein